MAISEWLYLINDVLSYFPKENTDNLIFLRFQATESVRHLGSGAKHQSVVL